MQFKKYQRLQKSQKKVDTKLVSFYLPRRKKDESMHKEGHHVESFSQTSFVPCAHEGESTRGKMDSLPGTLKLIQSHAKTEDPTITQVLESP